MMTSSSMPSGDFSPNSISVGLVASFSPAHGKDCMVPMLDKFQQAC